MSSSTKSKISKSEKQIDVLPDVIKHIAVEFGFVSFVVDNSDEVKTLFVDVEKNGVTIAKSLLIQPTSLASAEAQATVTVHRN